MNTGTINSIVFARKDDLTNHGFEKRGLWADPEKGILEYQKKHILTASVENGELKILYDPKWEKLFKYEEWAGTVNIIRAKLTRGGDKGVGKGKAAPE